MTSDAPAVNSASTLVIVAFGGSGGAMVLKECKVEGGSALGRATPLQSRGTEVRAGRSRDRSQSKVSRIRRATVVMRVSLVGSSTKNIAPFSSGEGAREGG